MAGSDKGRKDFGRSGGCFEQALPLLDAGCHCRTRADVAVASLQDRPGITGVPQDRASVTGVIAGQGLVSLQDRTGVTGVPQGRAGVTGVTAGQD